MKADNQTITNLSRRPVDRRLSILAIGARQCRWPVADDATVIGGILCCGAATEATYCATHRALSYTDRTHGKTRGASVPVTHAPNALIADRKVPGSPSPDADTLRKAA
jgi:hypothetical protein